MKLKEKGKSKQSWKNKKELRLFLGACLSPLFFLLLLSCHVFFISIICSFCWFAACSVLIV